MVRFLAQQQNLRALREETDETVTKERCKIQGTAGGGLNEDSACRTNVRTHHRRHLNPIGGQVGLGKKAGWVNENSACRMNVITHHRCHLNPRGRQVEYLRKKNQMNCIVRWGSI